jgi:hypothetical protein
MGQEIECEAAVDGVPDTGLAQLETDYLLFRGRERVKLMLGSLDGVVAEAGTLTVAANGRTLSLTLGAKAEVWAEKIRNPKTVLDKLGIKAGTRIALDGFGDDPFASELTAKGAEPVSDLSDAEHVFWRIATGNDLARFAHFRAALADTAALWIVAPKGASSPVKDHEIIVAGRAAGLTDAKVVGFSATHTALKFVVPVASRGLAPRASR